MSLKPGTRVGPYEILGPLGAGGMGEVYRANDARLSREVAIKVLPSRIAGDEGFLGRFEREAKAVAALSHPGILAIFDFGTRRPAYAVTELLEGETLRSPASGRCGSKSRGARSKSRGPLRRTTRGSSTATSSQEPLRDARPHQDPRFRLARSAERDRRQRHANSDARRADLPGAVLEPWVTCRPSR
jgi:hypothetical protein